jgi:hypothetical protein
VQSFGIEDLDANLHSYVVFGNEGADPSFSPQEHEIEPLSIMAVVCNDQVVCNTKRMNFDVLSKLLISCPVLRRVGRHQWLYFNR